jgi:tRNA threonylcarbamoyladenosine biosynthesis protein TsaB
METYFEHVLALDTSGPACSLALQTGGQVFFRHEVGARIHNQRLLALLDELFREAMLAPRGLDLVLVTVGPGAFTGLRIGTAAAQALAYAAGAPVLCLSSLEALALSAVRVLPADAPASLDVLVDARMDEVYRARFAVANGVVRRTGEDEIVAIDTLLEARASTQSWVALGDAVALPRLAPWVATAALQLPELLVDARALLPLALTRPPGLAALAVPRYLEGQTRWQPAAKGTSAS